MKEIIQKDSDHIPDVGEKVADNGRVYGKVGKKC